VYVVNFEGTDVRVPRITQDFRVLILVRCQANLRASSTVPAATPDCFWLHPGLASGSSVVVARRM